MNLSLLVQRKVTKRKDTPISLPFGFPQHSPLPTGRPDSPSGPDMTKSDVPIGFSLPKANASANFMGAKPYKRRSLDEAQRNPGFFLQPSTSPTGMRSTSVRGVFFRLPILHEQKQIHQE